MKHARLGLLADVVARPAGQHAKIELGVGRVIEEADAGLLGELLLRDLEGLAAVVELPAEGFGRWIRVYPARDFQQLALRRAHHHYTILLAHRGV